MRAGAGGRHQLLAAREGRATPHLWRALTHSLHSNTLKHMTAPFPRLLPPTSTRTDGSVDIVISNCVVNLSADKRAVLSEAFRVLADDGEFHLSDIFSDRRLPGSLRADPALVGEGVGVRPGPHARRAAAATSRSEE